MTITMDSLIGALSASSIIPVQKASATSKGAGYFHSLWAVAGFPAAGAAPGSANGVIPTVATTGALSFVAAAAGQDTFLAQIAMQCATIGTFFVYDRLFANSTFSGTVTTAQALTQPALTRHTDGIGVEIWLEFYAATGSTAVTATVLYTNTDGTTGRSGTAAVNATTVIGQLIPVQLAAGDKGVLSVQSVQLSATTGTAGNFGVTLMKRKTSIPISTANIGTVLDFATLGLPEVQDGACLAFMVQCSATNTGYMNGTMCVAAITL